MEGQSEPASSRPAPSAGTDIGGGREEETSVEEHYTEVGPQPKPRVDWSDVEAAAKREALMLLQWRRMQEQSGPSVMTAVGDALRLPRKGKSTSTLRDRDPEEASSRAPSKKEYSEQKGDSIVKQQRRQAKRQGGRGTPPRADATIPPSDFSEDGPTGNSETPAKAPAVVKMAAVAGNHELSAGRGGGVAGGANSLPVTMGPVWGYGSSRLTEGEKNCELSRPPDGAGASPGAGAGGEGKSWGRHSAPMAGRDEGKPLWHPTLPGFSSSPPRSPAPPSLSLPLPQLKLEYQPQPQSGPPSSQLPAFSEDLDVDSPGLTGVSGTAGMTGAGKRKGPGKGARKKGTPPSRGSGVLSAWATAV
ncbi:unnamed protein product, partial [Discosporangium mesarthrocarpum]